jgi:GH24 family phage-related lysozyme (muramidase)
MPNRFLELEKTLNAKRASTQAHALSTPLFTRWSLARGVTIPGGALERTKRFEGSISHMYLDTVGAVTVGVGRMLPDAVAAAKLAFLRNADQAAAAAQEIKDEFSVVHGKEKGKVASFYKQFTTLHLTDATIDTLLTEDLERVVTGLTGKLPDYGSYPEKVQEALVDMAFNLGLNGLMTKFPKFIGHIKQRDWKAAAGECKRGGISDARNNEIKQLLLDAAAG